MWVCQLTRGLLLEWLKLSTLDYLSAMTYSKYALFFKLDDADRSQVAVVFKDGLERTLSQARHLVGTIEQDEDGYHSFVKRKADTVKFVVQYIDSPEDEFTSFAKIEKAHFVTTVLGDINILSNAPMTYGEKPEASPNAKPTISSFKANFIPGGLIFNMHSHHYSNDFPTFDPKCLDRSRFTTASVPDGLRVNAPPQADRHPDHKVCQSLIFHLPKSKAALLKKAASPDAGTSISTYDAVSALTWRVFSKIREPVYKLDPASNPIWAEGVNMTKRLTNPVLPDRMQGNAFFAIMSAMAAVPQLSLAEIVSEAPFPKVAQYLRQMTNGCTGEMLDGALTMRAPIRNKAELSIRVNSFPPGTMVITDWRDANVCTANFGFANPSAFRHLFDTVTEGLVIVYPPRTGPSGDDEGLELQVAFEKELAQQLVEDPQWSKYFEFRGVDAEDTTRG